MKNAGFALVTALILLTVLMALLTAYFALTQIELNTTSASAAQTTGFYAAEAGLNLRAEEVRQRFLGYSRPSGTSPSATNPCQGSNQGSGDLACKTYTLSGRRILTYIVEASGNPRTVKIPPGELYENLDAQEYRYSLFSQAIGPNGRTEAILEMVFKSRLVPMFQFAAFYDKDLEILPGPNMTLNGRVHSNGDLYLNAVNTLSISGQVSTAGSLYRGRKDSNTCTGNVQIMRPDNSYASLACGSGRRVYTQGELGAWGGRVQVGVNRTTVPAPEELDPVPGRLYFQRADLRVVLNLNANPARIQVLNNSGLEDALATTTLNTLCLGVVGSSNTLYNRREQKRMRLLEVDMRGLLNCIHQHGLLGMGRGLDDTSDGGLVFHFSVLGSDSARVNNYGVRISNAASLTSSILGAPRPRGVSIVTDQSVYLQGDFNADRGSTSADFIPAAVLADSLHVLSNAWQDTNSDKSLSNRKASSTTINAAFLAGTDTTGGVEGPGGQGGAYNGGLENYPRFLEDWNNVTLTYRGSFVSLGNPRKVAGPWGTGDTYSPPIRDWGFETRFAAGALPPLSPRFVYLRQERFLRTFER
jgi:hypothetical protein